MLSLPTITKQVCTFLFIYLLFISTAFVCEGDSNSMEIRCVDDRIIDVIFANYGRLDSVTCKHEAMSDINCRASNSLAKVRETCQKQTNCTLLANNDFFGRDPCRGTHKYLLVKYMCDN